MSCYTIYSRLEQINILVSLKTKSERSTVLKLLSNLIILKYIWILYSTDGSHLTCQFCYGYVLEIATPIDTYLVNISTPETVFLYRVVIFNWMAKLRDYHDSDDHLCLILSLNVHFI